MATTPNPWVRERGSPSSSQASRMVSTVLDLSMGVTLFTSPSWRARK